MAIRKKLHASVVENVLELHVSDAGGTLPSGLLHLVVLLIVESP